MESPREYFNFCDGIRELKRMTDVRLMMYPEIIVLISGYPGSGKSTMVKMLEDTNFGGLVNRSEADYLDEVSYGRIRGTEGEDPFYRLLRYERKSHRLSNSNKLLVAGIAGAANIQQDLRYDPRLIVVGLHCNFSTRFMNLALRIVPDLFYDREEDNFWKNLALQASILKDELYPQRRMRDSIEQTVPDLWINTSIGSRISPSETEKILSETYNFS